MNPARVCPHLTTRHVNRFIKEKSVPLECTNTPNHQEVEVDKVPLWKCLDCHNLGCSRYSQNQCGSKHFAELKHPLCVNVASQEIWCYECDEELSQFIALNLDNSSQQATDFERQVTKMKEHCSKLNAALTNHRQNQLIEAAMESQIKERSPQSDSPPKMTVLDNIFGLQNIGNTCFFNSLTQCVLNSTELIKTLKKDAPNLPVDGFIAELLKLYDSAQGGGRVLNPRFLFQKLSKSRAMYSSFGQQDSQECLAHFVDIMEKEYKKGGLAFNLPLFGYLAYQTYCDGCGKEEWFFEDNCSLTLGLAEEETSNSNDELKRRVIERQISQSGPFKRIKVDMISQNSNVAKSGFDGTKEELHMVTANNTPLSLPSNELYGLVDRYFAYNVYQRATSGLRCDNCEKTINKNYFGFNKFYFVTPPPILIVMLKRYRQSHYSVRKDDRPIKIEMELNLSRYALARNPIRPDDKQTDRTTELKLPNIRYSLYGIVEQHGSLSFGHYICYVKKDSGQWYYVSDSHYSSVNESEVAKNTGGYLYFYRLIN